MKLGEILVQSGLLTKNQIDKALSQKRKSDLKLGQYLIREGIISESKIVELLADQLKLQKYRADKFPVDLELTESIPYELAIKHQVAPLKKIENLLTIAMIDPLDIRAIDDIERCSQTEVEIVICTEQNLSQLHKSIYGKFGGLDGILEGLGDVQINQDTDKISSDKDVEVSSLQGMAEEAPVVRLVNSIIAQAIQEGASDVHISPQKEYVRVRFRIDGKLHDVPAPPKHMFLPVVSRIKILAGLDIAISRTPQDGRFTVKMKNTDINIRTATIPSIYGENVVLRLLDTSNAIYSLERLGMSEHDRERLESIIFKPHGMILSTGPTGSGKSTSLYSILKKVNQPDMNIITIEDPVEYRIDDILQIQLNTKAGMTFASGLRSILRQDPDVIMVGEIRDHETANITVQAALTGHKVLSTLHTNGAAGAITRLIDMGIEPFLISSVMLSSFAQRLVRKVCPSCKAPYYPSKEVLKQWKIEASNNGGFSKGKGCVNCMYTGYKGRTGVYEVIIIDEKIQDMILKKKSAQEITQAAKKSKEFTTLQEDAMKKALEGTTTLEEAAGVIFQI